MDFVNKALGGGSSSNENQQPSNTEQKSEGGSGGFLGGIGDKLNNAGGGGAQGEKDEDALDKGTVIQSPLPLPLPPRNNLADNPPGVDFVQEKFLGQGAQNDESAVEQAKDEQISDFIRGQYKSATGSDVPVKDKPTALDKNTD